MMRIRPLYFQRAYILFLSIWACAVAAYTQPSENEAHSACLFKTVNYITHTLPQQCLRASWTTPVFTPSTTESSTASTTTGEIDQVPSDTAAARGDHNNPILSFEEWKELMLRQHGQDPQVMQRRPSGAPRHHSDYAVDLSLDSLGDDAEIPLNFEVISDYPEEPSNPSIQPQASDEAAKVLYDDGKTQYYRSKDAGKTCKERFSYSSFDAGATVLKTSSGTKNAKAILLENKDSYMLFECQAEEKYVIVELSDDILVDTVVLANFEFFSSMVRHFRVSVSDRYPVKADKWRFLGTFEAKNSRDIQPFLVDNPQIWAKYVQVEFLTHYGNEYFCPVSLLRVHGTRMMESWKETEPGVEEDDFSSPPSLGGFEGALSNDEIGVAIVGEYGLSPVPDALIFSGMLFDETCPAPPSTALDRSTINAHEPSLDAFGRRQNIDSSDVPQVLVPDPNQGSANTSLPPKETPASTHGATPTLIVEEQARSANVSFHFVSETPSSSSHLKVPEMPVAHSKNRTTTAAASSSPPPIVQDSFFKTITKRLQLLEANVTWTLKYVEDQSKYFQEAFVRIEERRLFKLEDLVESFNRTIRAELDGLQQQYDQVWQSTVIALETQREQSQSELVALSSRLNVLADEVVFQKRMSIGQSVLLLSCLILIIFSRSVANASAPVLWQPQADTPFLDKESLSRMVRHVNRPNLTLGSPLRPQQTPPPESRSSADCHNDAFEGDTSCRCTSKRAEFLCQSRPSMAMREEYPQSPQSSQAWDARGDLYHGLPKQSRIGPQVDGETPVPFSTSRSRKPLPPLPE